MTPSRGGTVADGRLSAPNSAREHRCPTRHRERQPPWDSPVDEFGAGLVGLRAGAGALTLRTNLVDRAGTVHTLDIANGSQPRTAPVGATAHSNHPLVVGEFVVVEAAGTIRTHDANR